MFYYIVSKLPAIVSVNDDSRVYKIFIIGSICYVILHAYLFSNIGENIELVKKYRNYIYYLWVLDLAFTGFTSNLFGASEENDDNSEHNDNEEKKNVQYNDKESVNKESYNKIQKLSREEMLKQLAMSRRLPPIKEESQGSPFIKKQADQFSEQMIASTGVNNNENTGQNSVPVSDTHISLYKSNTQPPVIDTEIQQYP